MGLFSLMNKMSLARTKETMFYYNLLRYHDQTLINSVIGSKGSSCDIHGNKKSEMNWKIKGYSRKLIFFFFFLLNKKIDNQIQIEQQN
jgi:hypothetical protein